MTRPGATLRALASRLCSRSAMEGLIDPAIADLQYEHHEAIRRGLTWRSRWILIAGYAACAKVAAIAVSGRALRERSRDDDRTVRRTITFSSIATLVLTVVLLGAPISNTVWHPGHRLSIVLWLIPQGLSVALPFGLVFGIVLGLRDRAVSSRVRSSIASLAVACSVAAFVILAWVLPAANQAFRELIFGGPLARGLNELTLSELASRYRASTALGLHEEAILLGAVYQLRFALALAPMVLSLFAVGIARAQRKTRGRFVMGLAALTISFAYYTLLYVVRPTALMGEQLPPAAVWLPDIVFLAMALPLLRLRPPAANLTPPAS
jgi:hypothetical protein